MKSTGKLLSVLVLIIAIAVALAPGIFAASDVVVSEENFPDEVFRSYVSENFDTDKDGYLSRSEIKAATDIDLKQAGVSSLKGIEYLTWLETLECSKNSITELDVSKNTMLSELYCWDNSISDLDVSSNIELFYLSCGGNDLTKLDVSNNTRLTWLDCSGNTIIGLDVSNNTDLRVLNCIYNKISKLDVSNNNKLRSLFCSWNPISELDVSNNLYLRCLKCCGMDLTELDVSKNAGLEQLYTYRNDIHMIDISDCPYLIIAMMDGELQDGDDLWWIYDQDDVFFELIVDTYTELETGNNDPEIDIAIDSTHFPDDVFRSYVSENFDINSNGYLSFSERLNATEAYVADMGISSLKGIEYLTSLQILYCGHNDLSSLDVSRNLELHTLSCHNNDLTALDVSNHYMLQSLYCGGNDLGSIDLSKNAELYEFACYNCKLDSLDVSKNTKLEHLYCQGNELRALDVSRNTALETLSCYDNELSVLDVSKNTKLKTLYCHSNHLDSLDVSKNTALVQFSCHTNNLSSLDISNNTALKEFSCNRNNISTLDVSRNTELELLYCLDNDLSSLDVSNNTALKILRCESNHLSSLNICNCPNLLYAYNNDITEKGDHFWEYRVDDSTIYRLCTDEDVDVITEIVPLSIGSLTNGNTTAGITLKLSGTDGYSKLRIQRKAGSGSWTTLTSTATGSSYTDAKANVGGTTYSYRVAGYAGGTWSDYSEAVSIIRNPFKDVKETASYFKALMWAYNNNIVAGTSTTAFSPNANCTRGQFALMLWRMNGKPSTAGLENPFTDVKSSNGFYNGIVWCYNKGITAGTSATTYSPNNNITRWQMILMFWRMQGKPKSSITTNPFTDVKTTASYYKAALWAYENKITAVEKFMPNDLCTRWQLVLFLYRLNNLYHYI